MTAIDRDLAISRAGGNLDLARELLDMLVKDIPANRELFSRLYNEGNYPELLKKVHKLHGATAYCGVPAMKEASGELEAHLKNNAASEYGPALEQLLSAMAAVEAEATTALD